MFPYTSHFQKTAKNPLICSRKRKVQKINPRHQSKRLVPCGVLRIDVCVQRSWQMLTGESPVVVKVGQPLSQ